MTRGLGGARVCMFLPDLAVRFSFRHLLDLSRLLLDQLVTSSIRYTYAWTNIVQRYRTYQVYIHRQNYGYLSLLKGSYRYRYPQIIIGTPHIMALSVFSHHRLFRYPNMLQYQSISLSSFIPVYHIKIRHSKIRHMSI